MVKLGEKSKLLLETNSAEVAQCRPCAPNCSNETDLTCINMSVVQFLSRNYSEDADENVVSDIISHLFRHKHNTVYEVVSKIFRNDALHTSTQLRATGTLAH
jgi:hypothetical protein